MDELKNDVVTLGGIAGETTKEDWNDFWETDGISMTGNPYYNETDIINFSSSTPLSGWRDDHITLTTDVPDPIITPSTNTKQKYSEDVILKELSEYISGTYRQHYSAGDDKIQTLDLIEACGDGEAFCRSNILKYASRYDKKGTARRDIMKILHYAVLLMHFNDKNANRETYPQ
jgi:hypothetical protein